MRPETTLQATKALHISWALFVFLFWTFEISEVITTGNIFLPIYAFARSESFVALTLGAAFCLAPFVTLIVIFKHTQSLLILALLCNIASMIYGVTELTIEANLGNEMILLATAGPILTVVASFFGIRSLVFMRQHNLK